MHPFEKAGLGKAPFHYVGMVEQEISYGQRVIGSVGGCEITTKAGGTCAYCGHAIVGMFLVESSDGRRFHVGCDCVQKVDPALGAQVEVDAKAAKQARDKARIDRAKQALVSAVQLKSTPHPNPYHAAQGKTMADYCLYLLKVGGMSGKLRGARIVEAALAPKAED